jgi:hypothetical protein
MADERNIGMAKVLDGFLKGIKEGMIFKRQEERDEALFALRREALESEKKNRGVMTSSQTLKALEKYEIVDPVGEGVAFRAKIEDPTVEGGKLVGFKKLQKELTPKEQLTILDVQKRSEELKDIHKTKGGDYHLTTEGKKEIARAGLTDFVVADPETAIPQSTDRTLLSEVSGNEKVAQGLIKKIKTKLKTAMNKKFDPSVIASISQDINKLKLNIKEVEKLGVIAGPDERLIDSVMGPIFDLKSFAIETYKKGAVFDRLDNLADNLRAHRNAIATTRGYKPRKPQKTKSSGTFFDVNVDPDATESKGQGGLVEQGNIDTTNRPVVNLKGGGQGTIHSMSFNDNGVEVLIPTVINGQEVSKEEAIAHYKRSGEHLGKFKTPQDATRYAQGLSDQIGQSKLFRKKDEDEIINMLNEGALKVEEGLGGR